MVSTPLETEKPIKLSGISWKMYQTIRANPGNRNLRLTYYRGMLEIMASSPEHEYYKKVIGRFVETLTEEFVVDLYPLGSTTLDTASRCMRLWVFLRFGSMTGRC